MGKRVAVIGGGAAGLTAAWRLLKGGASVELFESAAHVGGLLHTAQLGGAQLDTAVQLLSSTYTRLFALAEETGARPLLAKATGRDALWRKGSAQEITYGSIPSMISSGALPTFLKMKLGAKYVPFLTLQAADLDANDLSSSAGSSHDRESIAAWGKRELGDDFVEYLAYPLLAAYYGSEPEHTSAALYHALARVGMSVEVYAARGGMGALARSMSDAMVSRGMRIHTNARVTGITSESGRWRVTPHGDEIFDAVILATPPGEAAQLTRDYPPAEAWLRDVHVRRSASIGVVLEGAVRAPWFGVSIPRETPPGDRIVAVAVQQNKPAALVPPRTTALTIFPAPKSAEHVSTMNAEQALSFTRDAIERIFPGAGPRIREVQVYPGEYRLFGPGIVSRLQTLRALSLPAGLAIAGDYTTAPTVEGAVRSGERAASLILGV